MTRKLLILMCGLWGAAAVALPCPTCPKQMLYLPMDIVALPPKTFKNTPKIQPSPIKRKDAPPYAKNYYRPNNARNKSTLPSDSQYSHHKHDFAFEQTKEHNRYVSDMRKMEMMREKTAMFDGMEKRK